MVADTDRVSEVSEQGAGHEVDARKLLAYLGTAMIATGQPVHEIEKELREVGARLGYPRIQVGAGPTNLSLSLSSGAASTYESVTAPLRLDQASDVRRIRYQLVHEDLTPRDALDQLSSLRGLAPRYPLWLTKVALIMIAVGIGLILQPGWANLLVVASCAIVVAALMSMAQRANVLTTLLPTIAAFLVTAIVFGTANAGWIEGPLRTVLPPLAVLLPGAVIVTGMSELAAGQMQAGSSRVIFGLVNLGLFALGLIAATTALGVPASMMVNVRVDEVGWWAAPVGLLLIGLGICLMESVPVRMLPWVLLVLVLAFLAQAFGHHLGSAALGGLFGAIAASLAATVVATLRPRLARLVLFLPAFWLLVPGSLGLLGVSQLVADQGDVLQAGLDVVAVICAIALGLLVGSSLGQSLEGRLRRG